MNFGEIDSQFCILAENEKEYGQRRLALEAVAVVEDGLVDVRDVWGTQWSWILQCCGRWSQLPQWWLDCSSPWF